MDATQFEQVTQALSEINNTLGREPDTNFYTLGTVFGFVALVIAFLTYRDSAKSSAFEETKQDAEKRSRDAEFVFSSFRDYSELLDHLLLARETYEKRRGQFEKLDDPDFSEESLRNTENAFTKIQWKSVREVKRFYMTRINLVSNGYVTSDAAFFAVDNMGFDFLLNEVRRMDTQKFMENRRVLLKRGDIVANEIPVEYERIFQWYSNAEKLAESRLGVYGQRGF